MGGEERKIVKKNLAEELALILKHINGVIEKKILKSVFRKPQRSPVERPEETVA